ncbi:MAG: hypothetical protein RL404_1832 [Pseudomonadota bacterium]
MSMRPFRERRYGKSTPDHRPTTAIALLALPFPVIRQLFLGCWLTLLLAISPTVAHANEGIEFIDAALEATDEGYRLSSSFNVELTRSLEDALMRGVPLYFALQIEISRPRWYWFDEVSVKATRTIRLSYNVLTQQYRASIDGSLHRNFTKLDDLLALLRRPGRWIVAEPGALKRDATYSVAVQLALDVSQLPKPIQVSAIASPDWRLASGWARFNYKAEAK